VHTYDSTTEKKAGTGAAGKGEAYLNNRADYDGFTSAGGSEF
jgi:hypothetical protein